MTTFRTSIQRLPAVVSLTARNYNHSPQTIQPRITGKKAKWMSADEAVTLVNSDDLVFIHPSLSTPRALTDALANYGQQNGLRNVKLFEALSFGAKKMNSVEMKGIFRPLALFLSQEIRESVNTGSGDYLPIFLSDTSALFQKNVLEPRVALLHVSPADENGYHSLGATVVCTPAAVEKCDIVIGQVNRKMPHTYGDTLIHETSFDALVEADMEIPEVNGGGESKNEVKIGKLIAENLVDDGSTIQVGVGSIPDAVLHQLTNHKDLGIHTEMLSDACVDLIRKGIVNNKTKTIHPGLTTTTFAMGTRKLYDFLHCNPNVLMKAVEFTNNEFVISRNPKVVAVNSCIEIDLFGEVCSDTVGSSVYSGFGGQVDFLRGAATSTDGKGKPILTFLSTTNKGESKIVPFLKPGASVTTTRAHVHYVVTEYGIANLFGKNYRQRAFELINIAHPSHRQSLEKAAFERLKCMPSP